jgi:hypothetical protein
VFSEVLSGDIAPPPVDSAWGGPNVTRRRLEVEDHRREVEEFFAEYEARVNAALGDPPLVDVESMVGAYAEHVVEAHPGGVTHFEKEQFRAAIPQFFERQRSIGAKSMRMTSLEVTPVDEHHWAGKVRWEARYEREDTGRVLGEFDETYFVQTVGGQPQIFAYVAGDEEGFLKEKGLIPD